MLYSEEVIYFFHESRHEVWSPVSEDFFRDREASKYIEDASVIALDVVTRKGMASGYLLAMCMYVSMNIFLQAVRGSGPTTSSATCLNGVVKVGWSGLKWSEFVVLFSGLLALLA